jgi:hypothetical protein
MPYDEPDPTDPALLVGVCLPADSEAGCELAYTYAEEYASLGHGKEWILQMFRNPSHAIAHSAWAALGPAEIERIVEECVSVYGRVRFLVRDAPDSHGLIQITDSL